MYANVALQALGLGGGLYVALRVINIGFSLIEAGKGVSGMVAILSTLVALVGVFVYGRHRIEKNKLTHPDDDLEEMEADEQ